MPRTRVLAFWWILALAVLLSRLAHLRILWADEDYHLAAAIQLLQGKALYRDLWYDKPPLAALSALLFGGWPGWPLRMAGTLLCLAICGLAWRAASRIWGSTEGMFAAGFAAFFQIFYLAPAILPWEPDTLMILPHLAAAYWAWRSRPWLAGIAAGVAFLLTPKGAFVLLAVILISPRVWMRIGAGFAAVCALAALALVATGSWPGYLEQVWRWGWLYARAPGNDPQAQAGFGAILNWAGFHAALLLGALLFLWRCTNRWRWALWLIVSFAAVLLSGRYAPRYFDQLLPPLILMAAAGWAQMRQRTWGVVLLTVLLLIPAVRFGPRYVTLLADQLNGRSHNWRDLAMDQESRLAADVINSLAAPGDTLYIWGYRPNIAVYTRLPVAGKFWDSQPITGVPADRHLSDSQPVAEEWAQANRAILAQTRPTFIVDGLSAYNPDLAPDSFPDLFDWLDQYCRTAEAGGVVIYKRCR